MRNTVQINSKKNISTSDKVESISNHNIEQIEQLEDFPIAENKGIEISDKVETTEDFSNSRKSELLIDKKKLLLEKRELSLEKKKGNKTGIRIVGYSVVIIIIGILSAIALPNLLSCVGKARDTEGKNAVGILSRTQVSYHVEKGKFSSSFNDLRITLPDSKYYNFSVETTPTVAYALSIPKNPQQVPVRSYSSAIFFDEEEATYQKIICQSYDIVEKPAKPILEDGVLTCPENMNEIR